MFVPFDIAPPPFPISSLTANIGEELLCGIFFYHDDFLTPGPKEMWPPNHGLKMLKTHLT